MHESSGEFLVDTADANSFQVVVIKLSSVDLLLTLNIMIPVSSSTNSRTVTHLLPCEPLSFFYLILIHFDVCWYGDSKAAKHEVGWHRPGLAGDILNRSDLHAALLLHLPPYCILNRFPCGVGQGEAVTLIFIAETWFMVNIPVRMSFRLTSVV